MIVSCYCIIQPSGRPPRYDGINLWGVFDEVSPQLVRTYFGNVTIITEKPVWAKVLQYSFTHFFIAMMFTTLYTILDYT